MYFLHHMCKCIVINIFFSALFPSILLQTSADYINTAIVFVTRITELINAAQCEVEI